MTIHPIGVNEVKDSARRYWQELETKRISDARKIYYWYYNYKDEITAYIRDAMRVHFGRADGTNAADQMNIRVYNIVGRVIDKLAMVYKDHPTRNLDGGLVTRVDENGEQVDEQTKDDEIYQELLDKSTVETKECEWEKLSKAFNTVLVQPIWKETYMDFYIHTPAWCIIKSDPNNYLIPKAFYYPVWKEINGEMQQVIDYWSATEHFLLDALEAKIAPIGNENMVNPYGILPIAVLRKKTGIDFWGEGMWDLVDGNEEVCMQLTNIFEVAMFQAHGQPFGVNINKSTIKIGAKNPILVDGVHEGMVMPSLSFIQANPMLAEVQGLIDWTIKTLQALKGLSPQQFSLEAGVASGISKVIDSTDIKEAREDDIKMLKSFETDLYNITKAVWNYHNPNRQISDKAEFRITFVEPSIVESVDEQLKKQDAGIRNGTMSRIDIIMDRERCTEEEATEKLKKIIMQQRMFEDKFGLFSDEEININNNNRSDEQGELNVG